MNVIQIDKTWSTYLSPRWLEGLVGAPFLRRCREGAATQEELHTYLRQQGYYSRHFTRYLCALMGNVSDDRDRLALTQNLFEEMGLGDMGNVPHSRLYRQMLADMGVRQEDQPIFPETQALIDTMLECCRDRRFMVGLGALCLGAEAIVPLLYSAVVRGLERSGEPLERMTFFTIHIAGDDEHALTMRRIIQRELERDPASRVDLDYGAAKAISARIRFLHAVEARCAPGAEPAVLLEARG